MATRTPPRTPTNAGLLVDAGIAVAAFAFSLVLLAVGDDGLADGSGDVKIAAILITAVSSLPLVARRRAPLLVFVLTAVASIALRFVAEPAGPPVGATIAIFSLAATGDGSRARQRLTLSVVAVLLAAHVAASGIADDRFPGVELLLGVLVWGGVWLAGDRARLRQERMAALEDRAERLEREAESERRLAAAEERMRIARDLHDSAGHAINVILVHAGAGRLKAERDPAAARAAFETIEEVARETVGDIDELVRVLREAATNGDEVEQPPGVAAVEGLVERHRAAGLDVSLTVTGDRTQVPPGVDRGAFRILQEALTNAARHGGGTAEVEVAFAPAALELVVANPLRPGGHARGDGGGHGVIGMRERAVLLGGRLEASARDGRFEVRAHLPLVNRGS
jgi:signal transduction histidine kinase